MTSRVLDFFKLFLPIAQSKAKQVAPEIQREIDKLGAEFRAKVTALTATHSVASIEQQLADDIKAVEATAKSHIEALKLVASQKIANAKKLLPDVQLPPEPPPVALVS